MHGSCPSWSASYMSGQDLAGRYMDSYWPICVVQHMISWSGKLLGTSPTRLMMQALTEQVGRLSNPDSTDLSLDKVTEDTAVSEKVLLLQGRDLSRAFLKLHKAKSRAKPDGCMSTDIKYDHVPCVRPWLCVYMPL
uniref:Uncharacterized protein n=1 Tax=Cannabis sativa TaxID=3483 RepID=A0A803PHJ1_CANSA